MKSTAKLLTIPVIFLLSFRPNVPLIIPCDFWVVAEFTTSYTNANVSYLFNKNQNCCECKPGSIVLKC